MKELQNVVALHYTRNLPLDGYLSPMDPRARDWREQYGSADFPDFAYTTRWILTRNCSPSANKQAKTDDIVVIAKALDIFPSMISFDTISFTVGRLKLDSRFIVLVPMALRAQLDHSALYSCGAEIILYDSNFTPLDSSLLEVCKTRSFLLLKPEVFHEPKYTYLCLNLAQMYPHIDYNQQDLDPALDEKNIFITKVASLCLDILYGTGLAQSLHVNVKLIALLYFVEEFRTLLLDIQTKPLTISMREDVCRKVLSNGKWLNLLLLEIKANLKGKTLTNVLAARPEFRALLLKKLPCLPSAELLVQRKASHLGDYQRSKHSQLDKEDLGFILEFCDIKLVSALINQGVKKTREFFGLEGDRAFNFEDALQFIVFNTRGLGTFSAPELYQLRGKVVALVPELLDSESDPEPVHVANHVIRTLLHHHTLLHCKPRSEEDANSSERPKLQA